MAVCKLNFSLSQFITISLSHRPPLSTCYIMQLLDNLPSYSKDSFSALEPNNNTSSSAPRSYIATSTQKEEERTSIPPEKVSCLIRAIAAGNAANNNRQDERLLQCEERAAKRVRFHTNSTSTGNSR